MAITKVIFKKMMRILIKFSSSFSYSHPCVCLISLRLCTSWSPKRRRQKSHEKQNGTERVYTISLRVMARTQRTPSLCQGLINSLFTRGRAIAPVRHTWDNIHRLIPQADTRARKQVKAQAVRRGKCIAKTKCNRWIKALKGKRLSQRFRSAPRTR